MQYKVSFLNILLLSSLLVACGNTTASTPTRPTPVSTPSSHAAASPLVGNYATTITAADIPKDLPDLQGNVGAWVLRFANDESFTVFLDGQMVTKAMYKVTHNQLAMTDDAQCIQLYGPGAATGTYTWMLEGQLLTLKAVQDTCLARKLVFSTHPLVRQSE